MKRDTRTEARKWKEIPITMIGIFTPDYDTQWDVQVETVVGCCTLSHEVVRTFTSRADAEAFIASEYGLTRQALDGFDAWEGWWLS